MNSSKALLFFILSACSIASAAGFESLPPLKDGQPPQNLQEIWDGFDPRAEPLELEVLKEWEESAWPIPRSKPYHWVSYAVVQENWKLLTNRDASYSELYNLNADPFERTDLNGKNPEVVRQLMQQIDEWKATLPDKPTGNVFSDERE